MKLISVPMTVMLVLSVYVGLLHIAIYQRKKENKADFYFALNCFAIAVYDFFAIGLYDSNSPAQGMLWQHGQFFIIPMIAAAGLYFAHEIAEQSVTGWKKLFVPALLCMSFLSLVPGDFTLSLNNPNIRDIKFLGLNLTYYECKPGVLLNIIYAAIVAVIIYIYFFIIQCYRKTRKRIFLSLLLCYSIFSVSAFMDMLVGAGILHFIYTMEYSYLALILLMNYSLLHRFISYHNQVTSQNIELENQVALRTEEIETLLDELRNANEALKEKNEALTDSASRDSMTRLLNHAALHVRLTAVFEKAKLEMFPMSVLMLDIDYFKKINDSYGHQTGDRVIQSIADILKTYSRNYDVISRIDENQNSMINDYLQNYGAVGRYGGDEFSMVLPGCGKNETGAVCERVLKAIRELKIQNELHISASIGAAVLEHPGECTDVHQIIHLADQALYQAKKGGRNRFVLNLYGSCK